MADATPSDTGEELETITAPDGTSIAFERTGSGPPLVLVHGSAGDHTRWELSGVRPAFAEQFTVYAMDRRGRGESGDADEYALDREAEDVAAVVDAISDPVALLGHSFGALCALEAALRTDGIRRLVLYEPPILVGDSELYTEDVLTEMETLLEDGENERALVSFLRDVAKIPPAQIDTLRAAPNWQTRVDAAHTLPRETRAPTEYVLDASRFANLTTPTLLLSGGESPPLYAAATEAVADALPNSRLVTFDGHAHVAMNTAPERFVDEVLAFALESEDETD